MKTQHKISIFTVLLALGLMSMSSANAMPVSVPIVEGDDYFDIWAVPNDLNLTERKVFVHQGTAAQNEDLTGSIDVNDSAIEAYWRTTDADGLKGEGNGFAVIKGGNDGLIHDITFGLYNSYFEDVIFSVIPVNMQEVDFRVTGLFKDGSSEYIDWQTSNGNENFLNLVKDLNNPFSEINISSFSGMYIAGSNKDDPTGGGFTQTKQWEVSGVTGASEVPVPAVPVPAAVWLFGTAMIGFIGLSRRRKV